MDYIVHSNEEAQTVLSITAFEGFLIYGMRTPRGRK